MSPLMTRFAFLLLLCCVGVIAAAPLIGSLFPHGDEIVYVSAQGKRPAIYRMDINRRLTAALTKDEHGSYLPAWSPDGAWIAFHSDRDSRRDLYMMDALGDNIRQL